MSEWKEVQLGDISRVQTGPFGSQLHQEDYVEGGIPLVTVKNLGQRRISHRNLDGVSEEDASRLSKYILKEGDIVFSRVGEYIDKSSIVTSEEDGWMFSSSTLMARPDKNKVYPNYLIYYLNTPSFKRYIRIVAVGATRPSLNSTILSESPIRLPGITEQIAISKVLSTIDDKIELLRQQNQDLEELAQTFFKRWFVEFEFPNKYGDPFKSSGGEMIESELGEIPEGWKVGCLGDEFTILMGQSPAGSSYNDNKEGKVFYQGRTDFGFRFPSNRLYTTEPKRIANKYDVLVSVRAPVGDVNMASEECCIGRGLGAVKSDLKSYCFNKVKSLKKAFDVFENEGTVFGSLSKNDFNRLEIIVPDKTVAEKYNEIALKLDLKIFENTNEIETLTKLRDTLLPKLMSGELRVN